MYIKVRVPEGVYNNGVKDLIHAIVWELVKGDGMSAEALRLRRLPSMPTKAGERRAWMKKNRVAFNAFEASIDVVRCDIGQVVDIEVSCAGRDPFFRRLGRLSACAERIEERVRQLARAGCSFSFTPTEAPKLPERRSTRPTHVMRAIQHARPASTAF